MPRERDVRHNTSSTLLILGVEGTREFMERHDVPVEGLSHEHRSELSDAYRKGLRGLEGITETLKGDVAGEMIREGEPIMVVLQAYNRQPAGQKDKLQALLPLVELCLGSPDRRTTIPSFGAMVQIKQPGAQEAVIKRCQDAARQAIKDFVLIYATRTCGQTERDLWATLREASPIPNPMMNLLTSLIELSGCGGQYAFAFAFVVESCMMALAGTEDAEKGMRQADFGAVHEGLKLVMKNRIPVDNKGPGHRPFGELQGLVTAIVGSACPREPKRPRRQ